MIRLDPQPSLPLDNKVMILAGVTTHFTAPPSQSHQEIEYQKPKLHVRTLLN